VGPEQLDPPARASRAAAGRDDLLSWGMNNSSRPHAQRLPAQRLPAQRLPAQRLPAQRLPAQRLPAQRLPAQGGSLCCRGA